MSEYIGAKISLISKSNIRYVGTLHEINSENSTVALQNVSSFGTEGRAEDPAKEVPSSQNVFEYIVFRGSDVKDLRIEEQAKPQPKQELPDDPAILNTTAPSYPPPPQQPPQQQGSGPQQPQFQQQGFYGQPQFPPQGRYPYPPYGPYQQGPPVGYGPPPQQQFNQYGQGPVGPIGQQGRGPQPAPGGPGMMPPQQPIGPGMGRQHPPQGLNQQQQQQQPLQQQQQAQQIGRGPTSGTPVPVGSHPTTPAPVGQAQAPAPVEKPVENKPVAPPTGPSNKSIPSGPQQRQAPPPFALAPTQVNAASKQQQATINAPSGPKGNRNQVAPALPLNSPARPANVAPVQSTPPAALSPQAVKEKTQELPKSTEPGMRSAVEELVQKVSALKTSGAALAKSPPTQPQSQNENRRSGDHQSFQNENRRSGDHRPRGRGGHRGGNFSQSRKVEVPATDYDFESANAKFNKEDLIKEAIATASPAVLTTNGAVVTEEVVPAAIEEAPVAENGDTGAVKVEGISGGAFYNSGKSFFDNISCENKERAEGADGGRRGWRGEEQKKNLETFGQGSVDSYGGPRFYRGGWRGGRGRGYRRGGNSFGRGGGGGVFRGGVPQQPQQ